MQYIFQSNAVISTLSIALGKILSNVPCVALYAHVIINNSFTGSAHINQWMMLSAASTISGNLTILAAASNIIIIEAAERRGAKAFTFVEFFKIGVSSDCCQHCYLLFVYRNLYLKNFFVCLYLLYYLI
jgi:Na+/H+ antiporter NhaD/arsenite permease-like protein